MPHKRFGSIDRIFSKAQRIYLYKAGIEHIALQLQMFCGVVVGGGGGGGGGWGKVYALSTIVSHNPLQLYGKLNYVVNQLCPWNNKQIGTGDIAFTIKMDRS